MKTLSEDLHTPLTALYQECFRDNFTLPALTLYGSDETMTYGELGRRIARLHLFYKTIGLKKGDKVALMGKNTPTWISIFMGTITYGATIVPVLNEFNGADALTIINHSDAIILFADNHTLRHLDTDALTAIKAVISLETRKVVTARCADIEEAVSMLTERFIALYPDGFSRSDISYPHVAENDIAVINYTSGTTGFSKGVMLTYANLMGNIVFGIRSRLHYQGSRALAFLPLAHAYGCAFDMLVPLATGTHITVLGRTPTPQLLVKAMNEVKPSLIICVPLILEKIYKRMIVPLISKPTMRWVMAVPMLDKAVYAMIRSKLVEAFGGAFEEVIVGGAPLNPEVEDFLHRIKFPFTVGYGMTECGPLISYTPWRKFIPTSAGKTLTGIMQAKIMARNIDDMTPAETSDSENILGEICVRGFNVMAGYYKNPEATAEVLDSDGWLHTGDMGKLGGDYGNTIFIRGRYKTMLLSANGQNVYPEEIEAKLNNMPYVAESLVVERNGHFHALVVPDFDAIHQDGVSQQQLDEIMKENREALNKLVAPYEKIETFEIQDEEFEKTPKRSIRRFLYK
ncbi:MAG: AMP-binding protein [Muribaculaceae bacterium]|nr:AMP-binding protein [Muribaculaceae bacterium]